MLFAEMDGSRVLLALFMLWCLTNGIKKTAQAALSFVNKDGAVTKTTTQGVVSIISRFLK